MLTRFHNLILKVTSMIIENISWDSEPRYNMVEYKEFCSLTIIFNGRHGFYPFSKLIHNHDNMLFPPS